MPAGHISRRIAYIGPASDVMEVSHIYMPHTIRHADRTFRRWETLDIKNLSIWLLEKHVIIVLLSRHVFLM
jgi:hypothetical protein